MPARLLCLASVLALFAHAPPAAERIEEASFLTVGGIGQWVTIRGDDRRQPLLLLLHGGPGDVQSPFVSVYAPYERRFVLVQWDQRGAGATFARHGAAGVSLARLVADGLELAEKLRRRFRNQKLILAGHSWGTRIALDMVQQRPDLFDAYAGIGQVVAWADTVKFQYDYLDRRYREGGDATALTALAAVGSPDPSNARQYFAWSRPLRQFLTPSDAAWLRGLERLAVDSGITPEALKSIGDGMTESGRALGFADAPRSARLSVPVVLIQGRDDLFTPTPLVQDWVGRVAAPRKRVVIVDGAGHFVLATHPVPVRAALSELLQ